MFGWVKNVSDDLTSADPRLQTEIIQAAEGDEIILTLFFSKNDPPITDGFLFDIQLGGTAIGIVALELYITLHNVLQRARIWIILSVLLMMCQ